MIREPIARVEKQGGPGALPTGIAARASSASLSRRPQWAWVALLRPRQWVKNAFVLAPLLFSGQALVWDAQWRAVAAFCVFCALASAVYAFNDIIDRQTDRAHPTKRLRPVAAGLIGVRTAAVVALVLATTAIVASAWISPNVTYVLIAYLIGNILYGLVLKKVVLLDVFAIASFFVMRLLAGAAAVAVRPSVWLLLCGGLLALFLGFAKRRHEIELLGADKTEHRAVLSQYSTPLLDQLSVVLLSVTIVSYIMYTLTSETAKQVGSEAFSYSTVFVLYGVLRYLYLVHKQEEGGNPAETLLTDRALLADVILWVLYCGAVLYRPIS